MQTFWIIIVVQIIFWLAFFLGRLSGRNSERNRKLGTIKTGTVVFGMPIAETSTLTDADIRKAVQALDQAHNDFMHNHIHQHIQSMPKNKEHQDFMASDIAKAINLLDNESNEETKE